LVGDAEGRRQFVAASTSDEKKAVFDARKAVSEADYTKIPDGTLQLLESLSDSELALLSDLDAAFVEGGLGVELPSGASAMVF
jgi:hypothetical protein